MGLWEEMTGDLDFREPRVVVSAGKAVVENVKSIVMLTETAVTLFTGKRYVAVSGGDFVIKEIFEGRLLIEGRIQSVEFYGLASEDQDRRAADRQAGR